MSPDLVNPKASVEDAFMTYEFIRTHDFAVGLACRSAAATTLRTASHPGELDIVAHQNNTILTPSLSWYGIAVEVVKGGNIDAVFDLLRIGGIDITGDGTLRPNTSPRTRSSSARRQQKKKECKKSTPRRESAQA